MLERSSRMQVSEIADVVTAHLQLDIPPIALAFVETVPETMPTVSGDVPSACSFWRRAENEVFFADAARHFNCPIGAMTMGFALPAEVQQQLGALVSTMTACAYVGADEPAHIPTVATHSAGIVYGPLKVFPLQPDVILLWLTPRQAMLLNEAVGAAQWTATRPAGVYGRPACAAVPLALNESSVALSLGCTGMRTFTGVREDRLLAVLPGAKADEVVSALTSTVRANEIMGELYAGRKAHYAGA